MVKKFLSIMAISVIGAIALIPYKSPEPTPAIGPTISEYNYQKYIDYLGPEPEPFVVTYIETEPEPETQKYTDSEIDMMARVVMSEASLLPQDGKQAVAQTIINRLNSDRFPDTVSEVIYQPSQYYTGDNGDPTPECYDAVYAAIEYVGFPTDMYYFRRDDFHTFGYPYCQIGNTFFSTEAEN